MHSDPIADMLTRIRNAQAVKKEAATVLFNKINVGILNLFKKNGYIKDIKENEGIDITVLLAYDKTKQPKIQHLKRISKPGRRVYVTHKELPQVLNNYGLAIISTNKGLMTNKEAAKENLGGEIICEIY